MSRVVEGLVSAQRCESGPFSGVKRRKGPKALGQKYEKELAGALPVGHHGVWWKFVDENGPGWCQTDVLLRGAQAEMVLEAKYTYVDEAWEQLFDLYLPVVGLALARPVWGIQVCKRILTPPPGGVAVNVELARAIRAALEGRKSVLLWRGKDGLPLWPIKRQEAA